VRKRRRSATNAVTASAEAYWVSHSARLALCQPRSSWRESWSQRGGGVRQGRAPRLLRSLRAWQ
jgi:hypothetical protein